MSTGYALTRYSRADSSGNQLSIFSSGYKNLRFALQADRPIVLTQADVANLPGLAFKHLGDMSLWRVLLAFNGLSDPIQDIYAGQTLLLPTKASAIQYLTRTTTNQTASMVI